MSVKYLPPRQSGLGQLIDCILILALVFGALMAPLLLKKSEAPAPQAATAQKQVTWQSLGQNPKMAAQWEKLGFKPSSKNQDEDASHIITNKFDYTIDYKMLGLTFIVIVGYYIFVLRTSDREYREVINEKFGANRG